MTASDWAAWVQAIGSIAAILGGFGVAVWQQRQAAMTLVLEKRAIGDAALIVCNTAREEIRALNRLLRRKGDPVDLEIESYLYDLDAMRRSIGYYLGRDLPNPVIVAGLIDREGEIDVVLRELNAFENKRSKVNLEELMSTVGWVAKKSKEMTDEDVMLHEA